LELSPADAPKGFWHQSPSIIRSRLQSPPPDKILALIRHQPYRGGFEPAQDFPHHVTPKIVQGSIPKDLVGTLAINSAGRIRVGGRMLGHWFDGDGYMVTLSFDGKSNEARAFGRYVGTDRFKAQEEHDRNKNTTDDVNYEPPLAFSGAWTKAGTGKWYENIGKIPQSPANTAVMWLPPIDPSSHPRLFALCEGGHPIEVDPITLKVIGEERPFTSSPSALSVERTASFFSAHFSHDPQTQHIYNHGYVLDPISSASSINLMKLSPEGYLLQQQKSEIPYNTFIHDATISQNLYLYFVCPYVIPASVLDMAPFLIGREAMGKTMTWKGGPNSDENGTPLKSYLHAHSKDDLNLKWSIEMPDPTSVYHIVDAFEEQSTSGISDEMHLKVRIAELNSDPASDRKRLEEQFANQYAVPSGERIHAKLKEYTFLLDEGSGEGELISSKELYSSACEYPITNQIGRDRRLRHTWINALYDKSCNWFDAVQKVDMVDAALSSPMTSFGPGTYCGPPLFIPKECLMAATSNGEDEGYIVVVLYRSERHCSDVVILDSKSMDLLCTMELGCHLPYSFHGEFIPGFVSS